MEIKMAQTQLLEKKIGEVLGLEMAAQKAIDHIKSIGILDNKEIEKEVNDIRSEANNHQTGIEELCQKLSESEGLNADNIKNMAKETEQKATKMMQTYLGDNPDLSEALDFLSIAEGGEVIHYEALNAMAKNFKDKDLAEKAKSILTEEKNHLDRCIQLVKQNISQQ
jgi:ferritin-like metal-binding protein YciE